MTVLWGKGAGGIWKATRRKKPDPDLFVVVKKCGLLTYEK
jgi:hypothetical protein